MTDKDKVIALLKELGIGYADRYGETFETTNDIYLIAGEGNVDGYGGFCATFEFNEDGSFKKLGIWE
jgi:hypothetical protein